MAPKVVKNILKKENEFFSIFKSDESYPCWKYIEGMDFAVEEERARLFDSKEVDRMVTNSVDLILGLKEVLDQHID